jgi:hypothetical protein
VSDERNPLQDIVESDIARFKRELNNPPPVEFEYGDGSGERRRMLLPREEYESFVLADSGRPLTDLFPSGITFTVRGNEIVDIAPNTSVVMMRGDVDS